MELAALRAHFLEHLGAREANDAAAASADAVASGRVTGVVLANAGVDRALHDEHHIRLATEEHSRVYDAIASRDPERADAAMQDHMRTASQRLVASLDSNGS